MKVKNIGSGPRGVHTSKGFRVIQPGEILDAEFSEGELASMKNNKELELNAKGDAKAAATDAGGTDGDPRGRPEGKAKP